MNQYSISSMRQAMHKMLPSLALAAAIFGPGIAHADDQFTYSRAASFVYSPTTGLLVSHKVEPSTPAMCVETTYTYDAYGNKSTALVGNCAGASGRALFASRQSGTTYAAQAVTTSCTATAAPIPLQAGAFPTVSANALGQQASSTFDPRFGSVTSTTGPNCLSTKWQIDDFGRTVRETRADGTSTVNAYCYLPGTASRDVSSNSANCPAPASNEIPADAVSFVHSEPHSTADVKDGAFSRVYLDGAGRKIRTVTEAFDGSTQPGPANRLVVQDTDYNAQGAVVVATQPYFLDSLASVTTGSTNSYGMSTSTYDALGRPTATYVSDLQGSVAGVSFGTRGTRQAAVNLFTYSGLATTTVNNKNQSRTSEKNIDGQIFRNTDALGGQVAYQYDAFGNMLKTKDALQNTIANTFDIRGRKTTMSDPDFGVQNYDYDALGEIVWLETPNERAKGQSTTFAYDVLGRMTRRGEPEYVSTWTYDRYADGSACDGGIGKLCETGTDSGVSERVVYDALGRPQKSSMKITNGPTLTTAISYETVHGRVASMTYPTGLRVTYGYTAGLGYLETLSNGPSTYWRAQSINAWGLPENQVAGNGVQTVALFDPQTGRAMEMGAGVTNSVFHHKYTYDGLSNLKTREDSNGAGNGHAVTESYAYDDVNRLKQYTISGPDMAAPMTRTVDLQYNALGSLLYKTDVGNYTYPAAGSARPHAVVSIDGPAANGYQYDTNGNMVLASSGKYRNIAYTSFDLPDSNTGIGGSDGTRYTWQYDTSHARIKEVRTNAQGTRTTWTLHPDNMGGLGFEQEIDPAGATTNRNYLSAGGVSVGMVTTSGAITNPTNPQPTDASASVVKVEYWHKDRLGSISAITNAAGAVTQRMAYDPFGKRRDTNGAYDAQGKIIIDNAQGTDRGFTGHEQMDDIGIVHMNGRIYDANIGRFMQADPMMGQPYNLQNFDRYSYVRNNPLNLVDPSGFLVPEGGGGTCTTDSNGNKTCSPSGGGNTGGGGSYETGYTTTTVTESGGVTIVTTAAHRGVDTSGSCMASGNCYNSPPIGGPSANSGAARPGAAGERSGGSGGTGTHRANFTQQSFGNANDGTPVITITDTWKKERKQYAQRDALMAQWINFNPFEAIARDAGASDRTAFWIGIAGNFLANPRALLKDGAEGAALSLNPCKCFVAGTLVQTSSGLKPIEAISVGDLVAARNEVDGTTTWQPVLSLIRNEEKEFVTLQYVDSVGDTETVIATPEHPFMLEGNRWVQAGNLTTGDRIIQLAGGVVIVKSVSRLYERRGTYNIEVANFHTYFVGAKGVWVHNACNVHHLIPEAELNRIINLLPANYLRHHPENLMDLSTPFHGNHPAYSEFVREELNWLLKQGPLTTGKLRTLQNELRALLNEVKTDPSIERFNHFFKDLGY